MARSSRTSKPAVLLLTTANILLPIALFTFAVGFFPYKPFIPGHNSFDAADLATRPEPPFDKVIFMVVDALRSDFVYSESSGFSFVQSLIRSGDAIPFTGHATSPTITMPRVKALTTGSIPSFLDVILNFAESDTTSTLANQDTWPLQLSLMEGGKVNMFGDDTWIKLFPNLFSRKDGTTSFFVSDFTEVDNNVTRNVPGELERSDWNGMIMHYLGLDHIGHKSGPNSPNMIPKQREMDGIVEIVYNSISNSKHLEKTLLVLCGDHGMNEAGNHGGSAPGETSPALVFISPKLKQANSGQICPVGDLKDEFQYYKVVEQSDVVPTLAGLLGFPIPLNNLGIFIPELLELWPTAYDQKWLLRKNMEQIMRIVRSTYSAVSFDEMLSLDTCDEPDTEELRLHCGYQTARQYLLNKDESLQNLGKAYNFLLDAQEAMSSVSSNYNMSLLTGGVILGFIAYLCAMVSLICAIFSEWISETRFSTMVWICIIQAAYGAMMFASSYVEEEHQFWYWISSAWFFWLYASRYSFRKVIVPLTPSIPFIVSRVVRRWNQTGQKLAGEPDIAKTFLSDHNDLLWSLALAAYLYVFLQTCRWHTTSRILNLSTMLINILSVFAAIAFKIAFTAADAPELLQGNKIVGWARDVLADYLLSSLARYVFLGLLTSSFLFVLSNRFTKARTKSLTAVSYLHSLSSLLILTQSRVINAPLLHIFSMQLSVLKRLSLSVPETTLSIFLLQHASYFAYGGSNAISSIDLSNAYNGVTGYNVLAVGFLTFLSNWAGPVWWSHSGILLLVKRAPKSLWKSYYLHVVLLTMMAATSVVAVQVACLLLRTHLFIWTVFSPKYLYMLAWTIGQHLLVNILFGAALIWIVQ